MTEKRRALETARARGGPAEAPRPSGVKDVAQVGRLVHRRLYVQGHHPALGRAITGQTGPETILELFGPAPR